LAVAGFVVVAGFVNLAQGGVALGAQESAYQALGGAVRSLDD
jgi:hypothetical protein